MASGMARGAAKRGKRIAFGDGRQIIWDHNSEEIFRGNPNIAPPGSESDPDIEWVGFHRGRRIYNTHDRHHERWIWNHSFRPTPGEVFLSESELADGRRFGQGFVLVEPHVESWKASAPNKDWGKARFRRVAMRLKEAGFRIAQFVYSGAAHAIPEADIIKTRSFRDALAILKNAALVVCPEGGLHHGAAAMGVPAVVIFGGFIPPDVTGYKAHVNFSASGKACGSLKPCKHCQRALDEIKVDDVAAAALKILKNKDAA